MTNTHDESDSGPLAPGRDAAAASRPRVSVSDNWVKLGQDHSGLFWTTPTVGEHERIYQRQIYSSY